MAIGAGGAFASAGIAAASFGAVAKTMFSQTESAAKKVTAAQAALAKASTPKARLAALQAEKTALDQLTPSELKLYNAVKGVQSAWQEQNKALQPDVWRAIQPYIATATRSLSLLPLIIPRTSAAIQGVGIQLRALMSSGTTTQFAQFIGVAGSQSLRAGGSFLVDTLQTVEELLPQFAPLIDGADKAVVRWGQDMERWAGSASAHNGIQSFLQWIHDNAGQAEDFLKNLAGAIVNIGKAGASGGIGELRVLSDVLSGIAKLPPDVLGPVVTGLTAISLLSKFSAAESLLNGIGKLAAGATGVSAAAAALKTFGGAAKDASVAEKGLSAASGALEAITPFGWAVVGAAALAALGVAISHEKDHLGDLSKSLADQDHATGLNVAGYQKLARQLDSTQKIQDQVAASLKGGSVQYGGLYGNIAAVRGQYVKLSETQRQAVADGNKAETQVRALSQQYGIGKKQVLALAQASGASAAAWTGQGMSAAQAAKALAQAKAQVEQYVLTSDKALPKQQEENYLMKVFGSNAYTTATQITALDTSYSNLVGDFASKQEAMLSAKAAIKQFGDAARQTGADSVQTRQQFFSAVDAIHQYADGLTRAHTPAGKFYRDLEAQITALRNSGPLTRSEKTALQGLQDWLDRAANSQHGLTGRQKDWITLTTSSFLPTLATLGGNTTDVRRDMDKLATSISTTGTASSSTRADRAQLLKDLKAAGVDAKTARKLVDEFSTSITDIPKSPKVHITVTGDGSFAVVQGGHRIVQGPMPSAARGMLVTHGKPGVDDQLILAQRDELIVPAPIVKSGAVDHLRGQIPGFASGGVVGRYSGTAPGLGKWTAKEVAATETALEKSVASAAAAAIKAVKSVAGATTTAIGDLPANYRAIASFLTGHGYSHTGASGIAGNILQESGGNPESVGSGGGGLIGWTPLRPGLVTGNPGRDLATQLSAILAYNNAQGGIGTLNSQPTPAAAALYYMSHFERPAVATENAQRREAGANAVFKAMGYASGTGGAKPGWAKVGERGQELVYFHGGETVLPNSLTENVLSARISMPGYASGTVTPDRKVTGTPPARKTRTVHGTPPVEGGGDGKRARDEKHLARLQDQLARLEKTATAHLRKLRAPVDREQLYLLEHPGLPKSRRKQLEDQIGRQEKDIRGYRAKVTADEDKLAREIKLLKAIIADDPKGNVPPGKLPPGIGKMTQKQDLALLAKDVSALAALKKTAAARLKKLRTPVEQDELYLLTHPGLSAAKKAAVEADLKKKQAAVSAYRKKVTGQEDTYSKTISLLRALTGNPKDAKYGGAGAADSGSGDGGDAGGGSDSGTAGPPPGKFVGTLPVAPGSGGADITGGGSGGLGGSGSTLLGLPGAASSPALAGGSLASSAVPGYAGGLIAGLPGTAAPAAWNVTPGPALSPLQADYSAAAPALSGSPPDMLAAVVKHLATLVQLAKANPAAVGGHLGDVLNGTSRGALSSARWSTAPAPF